MINKKGRDINLDRPKKPADQRGIKSAWIIIIPKSTSPLHLIVALNDKEKESSKALRKRYVF